MISNKTAIIHTDTLKREFFGNWILSKKLSILGFRTYLTSRFSTKKILKFFTVDLLFLSHINSLEKDLIVKIKRKKTKIFIIEVEGHLRWNEAIESYFPKDFDYSLFNGVILWNQWSKDWLIKNRKIKKEKIHVVGSLRTFSLNFKIKKNYQKKVGIVSRFEYINVFDNQPLFSTLIKRSKEETYWSKFKIVRLKENVDLFLILIDVIKIFLKKNYQVSIRPHPNENIENYNILKDHFNGKIDVDTREDYREWLNEVNVVVGPTSTAFAEAYLENNMIIALDSIRDNSHD